MNAPQPGVLLPGPSHCRHLTFGLLPGGDVRGALSQLRDHGLGDDMVVGIGASVAGLLNREVPGLRPFPVLVGPGVDIPSTPAALWFWLRGEDRGELLRRSKRLAGLLASGFRLDETVDGFTYDVTDEGLTRDLTGFEDGTENPVGEEAEEAAFLKGAGPGLEGSTFAAVQRWIHDLDRFDGMTEAEQDDTFGRHRATNEEFDEAPPSAHVKRTAQEDFEPEAFVLRRSMPWADAQEEGLVFLAFGKSFDAFEAQLTRMSGVEDGVVDGLFSISRPVTGGYFWCPPVEDGKLDLRALGL